MLATGVRENILAAFEFGYELFEALPSTEYTSLNVQCKLASALLGLYVH